MNRSIRARASIGTRFATRPNWLKAVLHRDHHAIWVADHGAGRLVGYLWVHLRRDRQGYLPRVRGYISHAYLDEGWRGKGLMRPMLEMAYRMVSLQRNRSGAR